MKVCTFLLFYRVIYHEDGTIKAYEKAFEGAPDRVKRCIIDDIEKKNRFSDRTNRTFD